MENMGMERLVDAVAFAAERHYGQVRKDGSQYLLHPLAAAKIVAGAGYGEDYVITAVLHDILEDTETTGEETARTWLLSKERLARHFLISQMAYGQKNEPNHFNP